MDKIYFTYSFAGLLMKVFLTSTCEEIVYGIEMLFKHIINLIHVTMRESTEHPSRALSGGALISENVMFLEKNFYE